MLHGYVTTCASTVSQKASLAAWTDEAEAARAEFRETFRARRDHLLALIDSELGLRAVTPDGAFYTMIDVESIMDHRWMSRRRCLEQQRDHCSRCGVWR